MEAVRQNNEDLHQRCLDGKSASQMVETEVGIEVGVQVIEVVEVVVYKEVGIKVEIHGIKTKRHNGEEEGDINN